MHPQAQMKNEAPPQKTKIRCVLVHSHLLLRQGLRRLLEDEPDVEIVGEAGNVSHALQQVLEQHPDVVIADVATFGCAPRQVERLIVRESPSSKLLFLNLPHGNPHELSTVHESRYAAQQTSVEELVEMVREVHSPEMSPEEIPRKNVAASDETASPNRELTTREREVLKLLAEGKTVRSAAGVMGLSAKTVDAHKFNLMRKLGIHNKAELVMWAIQKRVVKLPVNL